MKKSIAIICEYNLFPERIGGMDRFFVAFDKTLRGKGHSVQWFFKKVESFSFYENISIISSENRNVEGYFLNYCKQNNLKFDIVITHFLQPVSIFFKRVKLQMNPYIINIDHNPRPLNGFPFKKRLKNKIKGILFGKYVDKIVGVSKYTEQHVLKNFGKHLKNKTVTIYNGIAISNFKKQFIEREDAPFKFIVISHLRESKGIQDLLGALNKLNNKNKKSIKVDIYGDGTYKNSLLALKESYSLDTIVEFKGNSPKINELLYQYHYLIQPTYMECFSLSLLESLASNVPVITTTVGGNPEIIKNGFNGYLFEPKDTNALAKIITNIVNQEKTISTKVNTLIEQEYTLEIMVQNHLKLIECI
ncbi:glycosyltransferase family 4 protein [Lutibacter flavus]|uniref:Glycosyltransferase involved in cell wall bisynthesis n=1 Tax=Lutibacter flavus TaxID=691689 RepID=A0A238VSK7_9FLAO|nr:glycosyltransferase family 4 protein [Lutibacter flavus]SNR36499.1 Glycosyltransferase involved in cell wall bisynthesis [Lutibacter flavus]